MNDSRDGTDFDGLSAVNAPSSDGSSPTLAAAASSFRPRIDGYEVKDRLGEGGMGTVWCAVQTSTRRQVALKLLSRGLFSERARLRFDREVEVTARLEHPHIARVYDSGLGQGHYYYAMELIQGQPIDQYVLAQQLTQRQILELMKLVALAVQHAHQRGVIHRDLKPSNILVSADGQPHMLDFGLAKVLTADATNVTLDSDVLGTPEFMSPEQAAGRVDAIDTRTDVYGLGATLYLLLTGHPPHDTSGPRYEVIRRVASGDVRPPRQLSLALEAELEWLLLKALAHDPEQRYGSASEMAEDIERYLSGEALKASPPSRWYRLRKYVRRNKGAIVTGALLITVLATATVISTRQAVRATAERQRADREAASARLEADKQALANRFLYDIFRSIAPESRLAKDVTLERALEEAGRRLDDGALRDAPETEASMRLSLRTTYKLRERFGLAEHHARRALDLGERRFGPKHPKVAELLIDNALALRDAGRTNEGRDLVRRALPIALENPECSTGLLRHLVYCLNGELHLPDFRDIEPLARKLVAKERQQQQGNHSSPELEVAILTLADTLHDSGKYPEAEAGYREVLGMKRSRLGYDDHEVGKTILKLEQNLDREAPFMQVNSDASARLRLPEREALWRECLAIMRKHTGEEGDDVPVCLDHLTEILRVAGKAREIEALWRPRVDYWQGQLTIADTAQRRFAVHLRLYWALINIGQVELAKTSRRNVLELNSTTPVAIPLLKEYAWLLARYIDPALRDPELAVALAERAVQLAPQDWELWDSAGAAHYRNGQFARAVSGLEKSIQLSGEEIEDLNYFFLAMAHHRLGNGESARRWYDKSVKWMDKKSSKDDHLVRLRAEAQETLFGTGLVAASRPASEATSRPGD